MFSRRTLKRLSRENVEFLTSKQTRTHVKSLNRGGDDAVETEWEVVHLNALSKVGKVEQERDWGGTKFPDIYFIDSDSSEFEFVADIAAASDKGIEQQYSMEPVLRAFQQKFQENGLSRDHIYLHAGGNSEQVFKRENRARLEWVPGKFGYERVFFSDAGFKRFLDTIKKQPNKPLSYRFATPVDLAVGYNPNQSSAGMQVFSYSQVNLLERNSVYDALVRKHEQLELSNYNGLRGIILCDGGSDVFHETEGGFGPNYGVDDIVRHFLSKRNKDNVVGFVVTAAVVRTKVGRHTLPHIIDRSPSYKVVLKLFVSPSGLAAKPQLEALIGKLARHYPPAVRYAKNALEWNTTSVKHQGVSFEGGGMCVGQ